MVDGTTMLGFLQNLSGGEMIIIAIVAVVVLGPERLPEAARSLGRTINKVKTMTEGLQTQVKDVMEDPSMQPLKELGELAARPRQKLTEYALEAEAEERSRAEAAAAAIAESADDGDHTEHGADHTDDDVVTDSPDDGAGAEPRDPATAPSSTSQRAEPDASQLGASDGDAAGT